MPVHALSPRGGVAVSPRGGVAVSSHPAVFTLSSTEQWKELRAGEPGRQGPAAPRDRGRYPEAADPAAGPRGPRRRQEV